MTHTAPSPRVTPLPQAATLHERLAWYAEIGQLAPSKHNSQPWRFLVRDGALWLWPDLSRALPLTDPSQRELLLSCGAAVHLACVGAHAAGYELEVDWLPEPGSELLARLREGARRPEASAQQDQLLLRAAHQRRTDRGPLDASTLPPSAPFLLQQAAFALGADLHLVTTDATRATLADLVQQADRQLVRSGRVDEELADWRRGPGDPRRDGVPTTHTRGADASYRAPFVQRDFAQGAGAAPIMDRAGVDAPLVAVLGTWGDSAGDWLAGGRALGAVLLLAESLGAHASYLNQPCEVPALREHLQTGLGMRSHPQVVLRLGVGGDVPATARRHAVEVCLP